MDLLGMPIYNKHIHNKPKTKLDQVLDRVKQVKPIPVNESVVLFEKYRPVTFNEILGQDEIIAKVMKNLNNLPHMIFEGAAGVGKTTLVHVISNELNAELLELNSSDERGIDVIRGKVMDFIRHLSFNSQLKIVFFDEADSMTVDAQNSLRAIIEKYSSRVRFVFACNDINKIIRPLKSRCKTFHFNVIDCVDVKKRLRFIADSENISISDMDLNEIAIGSEGDFRHGINELQTY